MLIHQRPTHHSNYGDGKGGPGENRGRLFIIWHGSGKYPTATASQEVRFLEREGARVSYHAYISKKGEVYQLVPWEARAWHAGSSTWAENGKAWSDLNDLSIGVAFESCNSHAEHYPFVQVEAAKELALMLMSKFNIPAERNLTHKEVSDPPGRKIDPVNFNIQLFRTDLVLPKNRYLPLYTEDNELLGEVTVVEGRKVYVSNELRRKLSE